MKFAPVPPAPPPRARPGRVKVSVAWCAIYLARALEGARRGWEVAWWKLLGERRLSVKLTSEKGFTFGKLTRLGMAVYYAVHWMYLAACWLTERANGWLPPLKPWQGCLSRLYPDPELEEHLKREHDEGRWVS